MYDHDGYRRAIHRSDIRPEYARFRRHSFGIGLAIFWAVYLAAMGVGIYYLTSYVVHRIP